MESEAATDRLYHILATRMFQAPPPCEYLSSPGQMPKLTWRQWYADFLVYGEASGWDEWSAARRKALLLHCVGAEARRLYRAVESSVGPGDDVKAESAGESSQDDVVTASPYDTAVGVFEKLFVRDADSRTERVRFRRCVQQPGETALVYLANLKEAVQRCAFGDLRDEMIRDQFIEGCLSDQLRDKLLLKDNLTLERLEDIAETVDRGLQRRGVLKEAAGGAVGTSTTQVAEVAFSAGDPLEQQDEVREPIRNLKFGTCYSCGRRGHRSGDQQCPAKDKQCHKCHEVGHFIRCCRPSQSRRAKAGEKDRQVSTVQILTVQRPSSADLPWHTVGIGGCEVTMLVDTGAAVSVIPVQLYRDVMSDFSLNQAKVRLEAYGGTGIKVAGVFSAPVTTSSGQQVEAEFYVADAEIPLLGRDLQRKLGVTVKNGTDVCLVQQVTPLPAISGFVHKVRLRPDAEPAKKKLRSLPYAVREDVTNHLRELEAQGVIEKVERHTSPWLSPIVAVRKRNGKLRVCLDLSEVNKAVIANGHPIPDMQEMLDRLQGTVIMSSLDMKSAYHQLDLHESSRDLTAFMHEGQMWRYRRCPFGLKSLPQCFQKMMECVLEGLDGVQVYLDDVIVSGRSQEEHDRRLQRVIERMQARNITLNWDKCKIGVSSVEFLGFTISAEGVAVSNQRVQGLRDLHQPTSKKQLQSVLGTLGFYAKFVENYSTRVEPLRRQLRKDAPEFVWTPEMSSALKDVTEAILQSRVLAMFDPELETIVTTDASDVGLGAVLSQMHPEGERVVCFASSTLNQAQRRYSVSEQEALACVWACEKWHKYLWGRAFILRTDHAALRTLITADGIGRAGMRMSRWAARLMTYSFSVQHLKGTLNPADGLSRLPGPVMEVEDDESELVAALSARLEAVSHAELVDAVKSDPVMTMLADQLPRRWPCRISGVPDDLKSFYRCRDELSLMNGLIFKGERVVVPESLRSRLVALAHESHPGIIRTKQRLRAVYWWPGLDVAVENAVNECDACAASDKTAKPRRAPLEPVPLPDAAWDKLGIDFIGPMQGPLQQRYAVVMVDYYSKWVEMAFTKEPSSDAVIEFMDVVASREGFPKQVVTDNGTHFTSGKFTTYLRSLGIDHIRVSPYHPAGSGAVERMNRSIKSALQMADIESIDRRRYMQTYLQNYRATPHATTGKSPSELLHGRQLRTKLEVAADGARSGVLSDRSVGDQTVRHRVAARQQAQKRVWDMRNRVRVPDFAVGDWVRYQLMPRPRKGRIQFSGRRQIVQKTGPASYRLDDGTRVHAERLARWTATTDPKSASADGVTSDDCGDPAVPPSMDQGGSGDASLAADGAAYRGDSDVLSRSTVVRRRAGEPRREHDVDSDTDSDVDDSGGVLERASPPSSPATNAVPDQPLSPATDDAVFRRTRLGRRVWTPDRLGY